LQLAWAFDGFEFSTGLGFIMNDLGVLRSLLHWQSYGSSPHAQPSSIWQFNWTVPV